MHNVVSRLPVMKQHGSESVHHCIIALEESLYFNIRRHTLINTRNSPNTEPHQHKNITKKIRGCQCALTTPILYFLLDYLRTPSFLPTLMKAAIARSSCSRVCPAESCTRILACPFGTTG